MIYNLYNGISEQILSINHLNLTTGGNDKKFFSQDATSLQQYYRQNLRAWGLEKQFNIASVYDSISKMFLQNNKLRLNLEGWNSMAPSNII